MVANNNRSIAASDISRFAFYLAVCLLLQASSALAQQKPLIIESSTMQPSVAIGRPMLTWWDVKIQDKGLVTGKFRFVVHSEGYQFASVETEELTLNGPEQRIRVLLPAVDCAQLIDRLYVDISFRGKKYSGELGQQILRVPFSSKSVFMCLAGESRTVRKKSPQRDKVIERLKFENLVPVLSNSKTTIDETEYLQTIIASIDPADFPAEPLSYCGYDVVILLNEEFRNLRKPQLEGMLAWIKAGGSLYVEPNGVLEPYHLDFLQSLTNDDHREIQFQVDAAGRLPADTIPNDLATMSIKCGLGDVVIRTQNPDQEISASIEAWRGIVTPLWKWRFQPIPKPDIVGYEVGPNGRPKEKRTPNSDPWGFSMSLFSRTSLRPEQLLDRLMPEGVRMVPLSLLAAILIAFVCLIGPGDYFVLGWMRIRKLTWLTFPIATLGVTALTVWLSNSYMSAAETRRALVIRDLNQSGDIVRTNRFELLFVASTHQVTTDVEKGMFTPLNTGLSFNEDTRVWAGRGQGFVVQNGQRMNLQNRNFSAPVAAGDGQIRTVPTQVQGRIPTQFAVTQDLAKWTPQINRVMSIPGTAASPEVDWSEFDLKIAESQTFSGHLIPPKLINLAKARWGEQVLVACLTGKDRWAYDHSPGWRSARPANVPLQQFNNFPIPGMPQDQSAMQMMQEPDLFRWIYQASVASVDQGTFRLMKQTTPKGGAIGDDLPLLDSSDPRAWLLVIIVPEKDDFVVYRKLMKFQD